MAKEGLTLEEAHKEMEEIRRNFPCQNCGGSGLQFLDEFSEDAEYSVTCGECNGWGYDHDAYSASLD